MRRCLPLLLLLTAAAVSLACSCVWFETEEALQDLFDESDVVLMGHAVRSLTPDLDRRPSKKYLGYNVLFRVTRVYKGQLRADSIFVLQQAEGNCARPFKRQDTVLVFGTAVRAVRRAPRSDDSHYDPGVQDSTRIYYSARRSRHHRLLRRLHARHFTLTTSQCVSFNPHNELIAAFIRAKASARP
ncbi:hypothetical protein EJV47_21575 [Hymenobacter gummosus]|uniref:DUF4369 domain-containing protein n=1 Tax=Hymenobacter gummosus TaxID=1776032 RepID=A0A3S0K2E1_9BACT|nr:hypothetical protein [Hymenobacter gummosus]RTQ46545.1 hypothetical protein EJV47_21575 [Hymenobacter gummosus]